MPHQSEVNLLLQTMHPHPLAKPSLPRGQSLPRVRSLIGRDAVSPPASIVPLQVISLSVFRNPHPEPLCCPGLPCLRRALRFGQVSSTRAPFGSIHRRHVLRKGKLELVDWCIHFFRNDRAIMAIDRRRNGGIMIENKMKMRRESVSSSYID